ncbi:MAG: alpha/beta hydrolase [Conexivisphaerales archaeon]
MAEVEPITGRYIHLRIDNSDYRVYFEESGQGIPVICGHTAGSDSRQWRHVLCDEYLQKNFRLIAFDLPGHGKSFPKDGWWMEEYRLRRDFYVKVILALAKGLKLTRPVFMGCSMGGNICPHLAILYPGFFRALIAVEASDYSGQVEGAKKGEDYSYDWFYHPHVHGGDASATSIYSLMAPQSPEKFKRETWWCYSQSAPGIFRGDLLFWGEEHDVRESASSIDTAKTLFYVFNGEYDWSTPPEHGKRLASRIKGAKHIVMKNVGHFPMSENPEEFKKYLHPVMDEILAKSKQ